MLAVLHAECTCSSPAAGRWRRDPLEPQRAGRGHAGVGVRKQKGGRRVRTGARAHFRAAPSMNSAPLPVIISNSALVSSSVGCRPGRKQGRGGEGRRRGVSGHGAHGGALLSAGALQSRRSVTAARKTAIAIASAIASNSNTVTVIRNSYVRTPVQLNT